MQSQTVDVVKRLKEITQVMQTPQQVLEAHQVTPHDIQGSKSNSNSYLFLSRFVFFFFLIKFELCCFGRFAG